MLEGCAHVFLVRVDSTLEVGNRVARHTRNAVTSLMTGIEGLSVFFGATENGNMCPQILRTCLGAEAVDALDALGSGRRVSEDPADVHDHFGCRKYPNPKRIS